MKVKGYFLAALSAVSYGLLPLFIIPIKEKNLSLDITLAYRFLLAGLLLLVYLLLKRENLKVSGKDVIVLLALGIFYALSSEFLFLGYDYISPGVASTIFFTYPVLVAVLLRVFLREKLSNTTLVSLVIALSGVIALAFKASWAQVNFKGLLICLLGALTYALYIITVNKSKIAISGIQLSMYSMLCSSGYFIVKSLFTHQNLIITDFALLRDITFFSLITTVFSVTALIYAIKYIGSTPTAIMGALEPVVAISLSILFFNEVLSWNLIVGIVLILGGVTYSIGYGKK